MLHTETIVSNRDFLYLYKRGKSVVTRPVVVYYRKNGRACNRIGITASKKIGNAVRRNRARRVIRAAYRQLEDKLPAGYDFIFVARSAATAVKSYSVKKALRDNLLPELKDSPSKNEKSTY